LEVTVKRRFRYRFWVETGLTAVTGLLCIITPIWPDWIEAVSDWDPDKHNSSAEWMITAGFLVVTAVMLALAAQEWRRTPIVKSS
jgi:hypothetical protein